jgi:metacaspase-1
MIYRTMQAQSLTRKKALLVGLNYSMDPTCKLNGCVNDARNMGKYLTTMCGFKPSQVQVVTDENLKTIAAVGRDGMVELLYDLCLASWKEDLELAVFHYSGHGGQAQDLDGDEADGLDEGLVPVDYRARGLLLDDLLSKVFNKFNPKTKVVVFVDACHSGTILDLPFAYDARNPSQNGQTTTTVSTGSPKIYCISGCRDNQVSMDAMDPMTRLAAGAMTSCALKLLGDKGNAGYSILAFQEDLNKLLLTRGFVQKPLLTSSVTVNPADVLF